MRFAKLLLAAVCLMPFFFFAASAGAFAQTSVGGRDTLERAAFCVTVSRYHQPAGGCIAFLQWLAKLRSIA